jgi:hypothetical protein
MKPLSLLLAKLFAGVKKLKLYIVTMYTINHVDQIWILNSEKEFKSNLTEQFLKPLLSKRLTLYANMLHDMLKTKFLTIINYM